METIKSLFRKADKVREQTEQLILAKIVSICNEKNIEWNGYFGQFENAEGEEILTKNNVHKLIKDFEDIYRSVFDPQFFYDPKQYKERSYAPFHMEHLDNLHKLIKRM